MAAPVDRISEIEARIAAAVARFRSELTSIEDVLRGVRPPAVPPIVPPAVTKEVSKVVSLPPRPGLVIPTSPVPVVPSAPPATATVESLLQYIAAAGLKSRPFDIMKPVIASEPVSNIGASYDAGEYYDSWIIIPSVDTRISFSGPPSQNTPFVGAGQAMNFGVRIRKIYYIAAVPSLVGTLSIWLAKYTEG